MLHLQYVGLLNTDRVHKGPPRMFLQGRGSSIKYVLDRLPPWIDRIFVHAQETGVDVRYLPEANLDLLGPWASQAIHQQLVEGKYKVRPISSHEGYCWVNEVFAPEGFSLLEFPE